MYAVYQYKAGSTAINVLNDVVAILTNETNVNNLSSSCTVSGSSILTTETSAGWTTFDASAGTNYKVLRAPWDISNGTGYHYIGIDTNTTGYIQLRGYESWNAITHTPTNEFSADTDPAYNQKVNLTGGGFIYISSQAGHSCALVGLGQSLAYGNDVVGSPNVFSERTRRNKWDTNTRAYPPNAWIPDLSGGALNKASRIISQTGADIGATSCTLITPLGVPATSLTSTIPNVDLVGQHLMLPLSIIHTTYGFLGGDISKFCNIWLTTYNFGAFLDEVIVNNKTYVIWTKIVTNYRFAVIKG